MTKVYKNWNAINDVMRYNKLLGLALATLDTATRGLYEQRLMEAFPESFNTVKEIGPVPLSVIMEKARADSDYEGRCLPASFGAIPAHIPLHELCYEGSDLIADGFDQLPSSISTDVKIGETIDWNGAPFTVVENNNNDGVCTVYIVPAECVLVDIEL